jgi:hypothetical protein
MQAAVATVKDPAQDVVVHKLGVEDGGLEFASAFVPNQVFVEFAEFCTLGLESCVFSFQLFGGRVGGGEWCGCVG